MNNEIQSLPLDLKYRPKDFSELVKSKITTVLISKLKTNNFPRLLNLAGPPGVGKTTLVYLISKSLQCESSTELICNKCKSCKAIDESGLFETGQPSPETGITVVDMGLKSGEEFLVEIAETVAQGPTFTKNKIVIIEEMQRTSKSSQDILLRAFENIPDNVYVMITGAYDALNPALRSRTLQFNIHYPDEKSVYTHIRNIVKQEKLEKKINLEILKKIIKVNGCNVRKILKQIDLVKNTSNEDLEDIINYITGEIDFSEKDYINFFKNSFGNLNDIIQFLESIHQPSVYLSRFKYFLEKVFKFYIAKEGVEKQYIDGYTYIINNYSIELLFTMFDELLKLGYQNNDSDAKLHLLNIAFKLNSKLNTPNLQTSNTKSIVKEVEENLASINSQVKDPEDILKSLGIDLGIESDNNTHTQTDTPSDDVLELLKEFNPDLEEDIIVTKEDEPMGVPLIQDKNASEKSLDWIQSFYSTNDLENKKEETTSSIYEQINGQIVDINSL